MRGIIKLSGEECGCSFQRVYEASGVFIGAEGF
jgi:hypothetical protein